MFTLDPVRRMPSPHTETDVVTDHDSPHADRIAGSSLDIDDIRLSVGQDLDEADIAIQAGRIEDAHRALIHAQDVVFERHLAALSSETLRWPSQRSTDLFLRLTNRLIDANRFKDPAIIADCRVLLDLMADTYAIGRPAAGPTPA